MLVAEGHALARAAALGVDEELGVGRLGLPALDVRGADAGVDVALAHPDVELAAGDLLEPDAEDRGPGRKRISWSSGMASMIAFAFPDVQQ